MMNRLSTPLTGEGLDEALTGVEAVVDAINGPSIDRAEAVTYFDDTTERSRSRHCSCNRSPRTTWRPSLADIATGEPRGRHADIAPTTFDEWLAGISTEAARARRVGVS